MPCRSRMLQLKFNKTHRDKVNADLAASGVVYKERMNMSVIAEVVMREQSEHL